MNKTVLIFPAGMPRALDYLRKCLQDGRSVVGASSLGYDPSRDQYPDWAKLPYVTEPGFDAALSRAISEFGIGEIYTPNIVVWNHLSQVLGSLAPRVTLANASPVDEVLGGYRAAVAKARYLRNHPLQIASELAAQPMPSEIELAALKRYADLIPGMCDDDKFHALLEIARCTPPGDIVEIGTWWGKSAFILSRLAEIFKIGKLLCVDPWANEHLVQGEKMVDSGSQQVSADEAFEVFRIGLLPFSANHINYLRMPSARGAKSYGANRSVISDEFGCTDYSGQIALLHIDGNHSYEAAKTDVESWQERVRDGGWIIIDDYIWPFGDGPKRVGDEFMQQNLSRIAASFVMGSALFIQLKLGHH